jgi:lipid-A-disaccharide synthase-like uncharacterized protein
MDQVWLWMQAAITRLEAMPAAERVWLSVGLLGQAMFSARFLIQWIASERRKESVVPRPFWYFSIAGGLTLLAYAISIRDPVFILGQSTGVFIYARNLYFIHRRPARTAHA